MSVDSYLELFTTMYGWAFAGIFRDILVDTGIVFLPFIIIIASVWLEAHQMARFQGTDAAWMVRKMEVEFMTAIFVFALCFSPLGITSLANVNLYHTPPATPLDPSPTTATGTAPGQHLRRGLRERALDAVDSAVVVHGDEPVLGF